MSRAPTVAAVVVEPVVVVALLLPLSLLRLHGYSLHLKVSLETTDTGEIKAVRCGWWLTLILMLFVVDVLLLGKESHMIS